MTLPTPSSCCDPCPTPTTTDIPGAPGTDGADGAVGASGINAYSQLVDGFNMPGYGADTPSLETTSSVWMVLGQIVRVQVAGDMRVMAKADATHVVLRNIATDPSGTGEYPDNPPPFPPTVIAPSMFVSPSGLQGKPGDAGSTVVFPTTTKGDIIVDNGALSPAPSVARLAAGTDGQVVAYDSAAVLGVNKVTIAPNAASDNAIARYNGTTGKPVPIQDSPTRITDDGDVQVIAGNSKGAHATDLQTDKSAVTMVASGANAALGGGKDNTSSGASATVPGGSGNLASASFATTGGGSTNLASAQGATVPGGESNIASGVDSFAVGKECQATGPFTEATGFQAVANVHGMKSRNAGYYAKLADSNTVALILRNVTTDATPTALFCDGSAVKITPSGGQTFFFEGSIVGVRGDVAGIGDSAAWTFSGLLACFFTPVLIAAVVPVPVAASAGAAAWAVGVTVVGADLVITVTGQAAPANIRWRCDINFNVAGWLP